MCKLYISKNLVSNDIVEGYPWDFEPESDRANSLKNLSKDLRRQTLMHPGFDWQTYSAFCGVIPSQRISANNPPSACRALVVDYDAASDQKSVEDFICRLPAEVQPNWIENTLGGNWRCVWLFEKEMLMTDLRFATEFTKRLVKAIGAEKMLPGYDEASVRPTQMWTTGLLWIQNHERTLSLDLLTGVAIELVKEQKSDGFEIPIAKIAEEVEKRFPGRWQGDFVEGARGVRFWDPKADNPRGAFIHRHGCHCFTGPKAEMSWEEIFGKVWVETNRAANFGAIAKGIFWDGRDYWREVSPNVFEKFMREDIMMRFRNMGLSGKVGKGRTMSETDTALQHVQDNARVAGAVPVIFRPKGILILNGKKVLNTSQLIVPEPFNGPADPERCKLCLFLAMERFARPELHPAWYFMSWFHRTYRANLNNEPVQGQALFFCGPKQSGKTLLCSRIIAPMLGNSMVDPYDYFLGTTSFNSELLGAGLLAINDERAPSSDQERDKFIQRVKSHVANTRHVFSQKFKDRFEIEWLGGRLVITMNDDAKSVAMLPDLNTNTRDKMMFFAFSEFMGNWMPNAIQEDTIKKEYPHFLRYAYDWKTPERIARPGDRCGIESFFDPVLVDLSRQQEHSYNLFEIIKTWQAEGAYWLAERDRQTWEGTPTDLLTQLSEHQALNAALKDWNVQKVAKALTSLSRLSNLHVSFIEESNNRMFRIEKFISNSQEITI